MPLILFFLFAGAKVHAHPFLVKHGYTTCVTCHYSPSGGGALTNYGKFVGQELFGMFNDSSTALPWLRTPNYDENSFQKAFWGNNIDWILNHQARLVQTEFDNDYVRRGDFYLMQADFEGGASVGPFIALAQVGVRGAQAVDGQREADLYLRRYYVGVRGLHYSVRAGKFFPEYGINHPNHNIPTRKQLFFNHNEEPAIVQASYYLINWDFNLGYIWGNRETTLERKRGTTATITYRSQHTRSGVSRLYVGDNVGSVESTSLFTQIGYFEHGYTMGEYAVLKTYAKNQETKTKELGFLETGWEFFKGFIPYLGYQHSFIVDSNTLTQSYPIGARIFPLTHFELNLEYAFQYFDQNGLKTNGTAAFAMIHWYF